MIVILLGLLAGLLMGLTGAGGSIIAVPLLMWGLDWSLPAAAPVALLGVSVAAAAGTWVAWPSGIVRYRAAILLFVAGLCTAPLGLWAATRLPSTTLAMCFGAALLIAAGRLLWQSRSARPEDPAATTSRTGGGPRNATVDGAAPSGLAPISSVSMSATGPATLPDGPPGPTPGPMPDRLPAPDPGPICRLRPDTGRLRWNRPCLAAVIVSGALTGFVAGLLGVGGGFIIVPALRLVSDMSFRAAVATSLMSIALTSLSTVALALLSGRSLPWLTALPFMAATLVGLLSGQRLAPRLGGAVLQRLFAVLLAAVAVSMIGPAIHS